jgi:Fur family ferric uptake transcriptional regulator
MMTTWEERLAAAGCRITASRRAVVRALNEAGGPLLPQEILERGQQIHQKLGLVTVYRTLNLLVEMSIVRRIHQENGCHSYTLASPGHRHALICQDCNRTVEFPGEDDIHALIGRIEAETGYRVQDHLLQLFGLCPDCQEVEV